MKNNQSLKLDEKIFSKLTDEVRLKNIINFIISIDSNDELITALPQNKLKDFADNDPGFFNNISSDYSKYCTNINAEINAISYNKINAAILYFRLLNVFNYDDSTYEKFENKLIDYFRLNIKNNSRIDFEKIFLITFDSFDKVIENMFLLFDLTKILNYRVDRILGRASDRDIAIDNLYNARDHNWLFNFTITQIQKVTKYRFDNDMHDWIYSMSTGNYTSDHYYFLACILLENLRSSSDQKLILDTINHNISAKKYSSKHKNVSVAVADHEKLREIANKKWGGNVKLALSQLIEEKHSELFE